MTADYNRQSPDGPPRPTSRRARAAAPAAPAALDGAAPRRACRNRAFLIAQNCSLKNLAH